MDIREIGRYQVVRELGRGAGGVVYLAEDPKIGRKVAIKTILAQTIGVGGQKHAETLRRRLLREAKSAGALAHPNIVTVFEMDEGGPMTYIVMEFIEGSTLRDAMEAKNRLETAEALRLLEQAAAGLDYAHARSVVHRDVKPANIMITDDGTVKIADFGVAKVLSEATLALTQAGAAVGTPHYMSPEQVLGKPVDGRSDQFSLAVIGYELLAGRRPFDGDSLTTVMYQIVNEDPLAPQQLDVAIPPAAMEVMLRALAKEPEHRYDTCRRFVEELRQAVRPAAAPVVPAATPVVPAAAPVVPVAAPVVPVGTPVVPAAAPVGPVAAPVVPASTQAAPVAPSAPAPSPSVEVPDTTLAPAQTGNRKTVLRVAAAAVLVALAALLVLTWERRTASKPVVHEAVKTQTPAPVPASTPPPVLKTAAPVAVKKAPAVIANPPAAAAEKPLPPVRGGSFQWTGDLAGGDSLGITGNEADNGTISGGGLPRRAAVMVEVDPPDVKVSEEPSADNGYKLLLINEGREVTSISVSWKPGKRKEGE